MVNPEVCSPLTKKNKRYSCYSEKQLTELKRKYNMTRSKKIKSSNPVKIWQELDENIQNCTTESCWAKELNVPVKDVFAPKCPDSWKNNKNEWLSSTDITAVLRQYEKAYPEFKYIGPSPSDYYVKEYGKCVWPELCAFNVNTTNHKYIGIVFNLDTHNGTGTHWVSIFINMPKKKIYYFDSTGEKIHENIQHLVDQIQAQNPKFKFFENYPSEHQFENTECGMYTLFFLVTMLTTRNYNLFNGKQRFPDKAMEKLRKKYFNS